VVFFIKNNIPHKVIDLRQTGEHAHADTRKAVDDSDGRNAANRYK
jgi:hypothetical protein